MPIILTRGHRNWPRKLKPIGFGSFDLEPFTSWWERNAALLPPLDPRVYEQWVHRHWTYSPYFGFPLRNLSSRCVQMTTEVLLNEVGTAENAEPHPNQPSLESEYQYLSKSPYEPVVTMNRTGTWDFPVLLIESEDGFIYHGNEYSYRFWLLEGHLRMRYLAPLAAKGQAAAAHAVLVLSYGQHRTRARQKSPNKALQATSLTPLRSVKAALERWRSASKIQSLGE